MVKKIAICISKYYEDIKDFYGDFYAFVSVLSGFYSLSPLFFQVLARPSSLFSVPF